jgi:hypothetical protein
MFPATRNHIVYEWLARGAGVLVFAALAFVGVTTFGEPPVLHGKSGRRRGRDARAVDQRPRPDKTPGDFFKWRNDSRRLPTPMKERPGRAAPRPGALPYPYAKVRRRGALRLHRLPTAGELRLIARAEEHGGGWPSVVQKRMVGIFFVALDRPAEHLGQSYYRTVADRYVLKSDLEVVTPPSMRGERLGEDLRLPVAFVFGEDRPALCPKEHEEEARYSPCGLFKKHDRFEVAYTVERGEGELVAAPSGRLVERDAVRGAGRIARPAGIPKGARWLHVNLAQQTLVAYEGDAPVFVTLVSSGREGHYTPIGLYRITRKDASVTMQGADPEEGWYEVAEVPWTMWYRKNYAVHGAYWHDDFGTPRSHGCTNLSPADARWLFRWIGSVKERAWVYFSADVET